MVQDCVRTAVQFGREGFELLVNRRKRSLEGVMSGLEDNAQLRGSGGRGKESMQEAAERGRSGVGCVFVVFAPGMRERPQRLPAPCSG
eukprot:61815-Pleurochrysis_carterae.AAC.4